MERVTETLVYEYWDCDYCDRKAIRGDCESCSMCGHARDAEIHFYRLENQEEAVEAEASARHLAGSDWICAFCQTLNDPRLPACRACRADRESSEATYLEREAKQVAAAAPAPKKVENTSPTEGSKPQKRRPRWPFVVGGLLLVLGAGLFWAMRTHPVEFKVQALAWERSIPIERFQWFTDTAWEGELKGEGAVTLESKRELHHTDHRQVGTKQEHYSESQRYQAGTKEKCSTSYKSTGSGASKKVRRCKDVPVYKTRQVQKTRSVPAYQDFPIYKQKLRYKAKRYQLKDTAKASGADNQPHWPTPTLGVGEDGRKDREGKRSQSFLVTLKRLDKDNAKPIVIETTEARFTNSWRLNSTLQLPMSSLGGLTLGPGEKLR